MNDELIPCTVELERLKIFLKVLSQLKKNARARRFFPDEYYKDLPGPGGWVSVGHPRKYHPGPASE